MDLTPTSSTRTTDIDTQTPPQTQPTNTNKDHPKSSSFTNGSLKRNHLTTVQPPPQPPSTVVSYKECLKNHAASLGGHALDGCGEFMPSPSSSPTQPRSLTCAACGCHRNFHRRDTLEYSNPNFISFYHSPPPPPHHGLSLSISPSPGPSLSPSPMSSPSPPPLSHHFPPSYHHYHQSSAPHMLLALGNEHQRSFNFNKYSKTENPSGKKRHRTRFSEEQKEKMHSFSEKLGWRMQKGDEGLVEEFCNEIGVSKGVFKVWMHNNKNTFRKRSLEGGDQKINGNDGSDCNNKNNNNPYNTNSSDNVIHRD